MLQSKLPYFLMWELKVGGLCSRWGEHQLSFPCECTRAMECMECMCVYIMAIIYRRARTHTHFSQSVCVLPSVLCIRLESDSTVLCCVVSCCVDREMRLGVSKQCGWIKGVWHSSIQSDGDAGMRRWLSDMKKTESRFRSHTPSVFLSHTPPHAL